jgi:hypothetical protein
VVAAGHSEELKCPDKDVGILVAMAAMVAVA